MIKKYSITLLLLLCAFSLLAQEQAGIREKANEYFTGYEFGKATLLYQQLVDKKSPRLEDMERLAYSSYQINDYELAVNWYARVVENPDSSPENLLMYAQALKQTMRYHEAKVALERYGSVTGNRNEIRQALKSCDLAIAWLESPKDMTLENVTSFNTPLSEFGAYVVKDKIYYTGETSSKSKRYSWTGNSFLQVFSASDSDSLGTPELFKPFNEDTKYHIGPVSSDASGDVFFVTQTYVGKKGDLNKIGKKKYRTNRLELIIYSKDAQGKWSSTPFPYNNIKEYSVGHATLSNDQQVLYFVSDMPGGLGGTDIWFCERTKEGSWGTPQNAGNQINTAQNELFPHISPEGVLYFSSNGFAGMGGLDIFQSEGSKANWTSPMNLQYPANSSGDDFAFVITQIKDQHRVGYLSSDRQNGQGGDDIYSFTYSKKPNILLLEGLTFQGQGENTILPEVMVSLKAEDQTLIAKKLSNDSGAFTFEIKPDMEYKLIGQKTTYYSDSLVFHTRNLKVSDTVRVTLHLEPLFEIGKKFVLQDIYYDFDQSNIRSDAAAILNEVMRIMRSNPTLKIELSSHTDSRGSDNYNMKLSHRRAQSAVDYLVSRGIARDRMQAKGYGESQLMNNCSNGMRCSGEAHQENRRTEIRVLAF